MISSSESITESKIIDLKYPLIIKPSDSHSSRGVYKCESFEDIVKHSIESVKYSSDGSIIIEEFIEGNEYSVESLTFNNVTEIIQITEKLITPYPETVELRHIQPADLSIEDIGIIKSLVQKVIDVLGINNSASHTEFKMTKEGPVIIEIGPRLGGDFISSYLTKASCGIDMDRASIQIALGEKPFILKKTNKYACVKYIELEPNKQVRAINDYSELLSGKDLIFAHVFCKKGKLIPKLVHSGLRSAVIIVKADTKEKLLKTIDYYENEIKKRIILE